MSESVPLAIVGISCLFPKADGLQAYWRNIKNGVDAITPIPASHWNAADYFDADPKAPDRTYARRGGFLPTVSFNPMEFGIAPKDLEATDTTQLLGMMAAKQALVDAGYAEKTFNKDRTSVVLGVTGALELVIPLGARLGHPLWRRALKEAGVLDTVAEDVVQRISDSYVGWQENSFPGLLGNVTAGRIANRLNLGGTNCVVDAACASSMAAVHLAGLELAAGRSDMVITGGVDTFNDIFMYMCFSKTPALSPSGDAKPFDKTCDGTILGEGIGMLVLKRLSDARKDKDRIYAVIKGIGSSSDGSGGAIYAPQSGGQQKALCRAYADSGITPDTIELVEAHGTGTKVGDATEIKSLNEVFRAVQPKGTWAALGSVKSQIGHTKAAAGVAGLIKAALALDHKVLPPTIKVTHPVSELAPGQSPFYVNTQKRPWLPRLNHPRRAGVSAFGFGGTNFHCVLEESSSEMSRPGWDGDTEIFAFSADQAGDIRTKIAALPVDAPWAQIRFQAAESRRQFQRNARHRLLFPAIEGTPLATVRDAILIMLDKHPEKTTWSLPNGAAFGTGPKRGKLGALFPGQGSQYVGMFRDLACQFPAMIDAMAAADRVFATVRPDCGQQRLSDFVYPYPAFNDEDRKKQEEALKSTDIAQPALGAAGLGAMNVLTYFGITPEAAAGHSYGELLALCGAGCMETETLHKLSNLRGRLMAHGNGSDRGSMLAAQASEDVVTRFVKEEKLQLVVANRNSPSQFVLAGPTNEIEQAAGKLAKRSVRARVLKVSAAFHSAFVADAREPFAAALENVPFKRGRIPVYANTTAKAYPSEPKQARELLANQIVKPVDFMAQIETMYADGVTTFVEMGPGHVLSDLVQAILQGKEVDAIALDSSKGSRSGVFDLAATLCRVAALGHAVDLTRWEETPKSTAQNGKAALMIPLTGANHRNPKPKRAAVAKNGSNGHSNGTNGNGALHVHSNGHSNGFTNGNGASNGHGNGFAHHPINVPQPAAATPRPIQPAASSNISTAQASDALLIAQQGMMALQQLQEETARLHKQFLESQDAARRTLESLLTQRRDLVSPAPANGFVTHAIPQSISAPVAAVAPAPVTAPEVVPAPAPVSIPTPPPALETKPIATPAPVQSVSSSVITQTVLDVVAEKTGYPAEMLTLDMGLDSDLGIDSIKRVEIMAALRGKLPQAPEIKPEHLGSLQTLRQVAEFLSQGNTSTASFPSNVVTAVAAPVTTPEKVETSASNTDISTVVLEIVGEKTGYPVEMLNLDMGLDSDLGVDSIKRVEIMAAIRTRLPAAPEIKPDHLGSLQTLRQIVEFLGTSPISHTSTAPTPVETHSTVQNTPSQVDASTVTNAVLGVVAEKTGYPTEMLNLDMGLDADLGVDSIKRVEIMAALRTLLPTAPEIKPEHLGTIQTLRQIVEFLTTVPAPASTPAVATNPVITNTVASSNVQLRRQIVRPVALSNANARPAIKLPANSLVWVSENGSPLASNVEAQLKKLGHAVVRGLPSELISKAPTEKPAAVVALWPQNNGADAQLKDLFRLIQTAGPSLKKARGILLTVSSIDGQFGFGAREAFDSGANPISGGLAGIVKTARHEWPEVHCKALDLDPTFASQPEAATGIVEELFLNGPIEVGLTAKGRVGLQIETIAQKNVEAPAFDHNDVIVVSGGARGITAKTVERLARQFGCKWVLLGRSPLASTEPEWLINLTNEAEIKKALVARANSNSSPKKIEQAFREIMAQREIRECLRLIKAAGAVEVAYRAVDARNAADVQHVVAEIRSQWGPIRGIIHGAGVLADRRIEDKKPEQFDLVYGTKVDGLRNLLTAAGQDELKVIALFSSYTGRFGRTGQVDYAAANEVLNKMAQFEARQRPECRVVSFNWGPWNGGMVNEGLKKLFEREGIGLIDLQAGTDLFAREISARGDNPVEVLVLATPPNASFIVEPGALNVAFEREIDVKTVPCLQSHVLNGRAVLPSVLMIEWLGHGAMHDNPGLYFHGFENFKVLKGLLLDKNDLPKVSVLSGTGHARDGLYIVPVQLTSQLGEHQVVHARADILLTETLPAAPAGASPRTINGSHYSYNDGQLFHGSHFQGLDMVEFGPSSNEAAAWVKAAPSPKHWVQHPLRPSWLSDPLALDSAFQLVILWSWKSLGAACLPCAIGNLHQYVSTFPKEGCQVSVQIKSAENALVDATLRFHDRRGNLLAVIEGYESVIDEALREVFRQNSLPQ